VENGCAVTFGQSITDACLSWEDTETLLAMLADAAQVRLDKQKA
ncbi:3-deoxy-7-phosphoheptulonate synthase, partial [Aeromonas rivipollensis]